MAASQTKKTSKGKSKTASKKKQSNGNSALYGEIAIVVTFAICVLLLISNFGIGGSIGNTISSVMFGIFGLLAYIMPVILFSGIAFIIINKDNSHAYIKCCAGIAVVFSLSTFIELIVNSYNPNASWFSYYTQASIHKNAGGLVGGCLVKLLCPLIGVVGTFIVVVTLLIISSILITEKSFLSFLHKNGKRVYDDTRQRKSESDLRRAQRQKEREQTKNRQTATQSDTRKGVSFDTTLSRKSPELKELEPAVPEKEKAAKGFGFVIERPDDTPTASDSAANMEDTPLEAPQKEPAKRTRRKKTTEDAAVVAAEVAGVSESIKQQEQEPLSGYRVPPLSLLNKGKSGGGDSDAHLRETATKLEMILQNFGVNVHVMNASCGPSVTRYELQPEMGVKVSKIVGLADDIKLNLAVADLRIEAPIPGKAAVGIEVPNKETSPVMLRDLLETPEFQNSKSPISFATGKDIAGKVVVSDIAKMPHVLVAGATGSGKSVCINTLIMSVIYKADPNDVKLIMIDPKVVELSVYNGIPHLLIPVVTDPKKAAGALNWAVAEMEKRYRLFADYNVRDLKGFNEKVGKSEPEDGVPNKLPQIIIIVDELADLMMVAPGEVEGAICRLAQLARAAGLHLVIATQRPSVNVITGLIKANMPSRIAFSVTSGVDSRTIIDMNGAEKLLGKGDMLFYPAGYPKPVRVQGSFVSDQEVQKVVDYLIEQNGRAAYSETIENEVNTNISNAQATVISDNEDGDARDVYFMEAGEFIVEKEKASIGMLQRVFKIGFNRAARIMDQLCEAGVVGPEEGTKPRKVLMTKEEFEEFKSENQ